MPKPDMLNLRTAESTVTLTEKPQGVDYSRVRDLTLPEYFSLSKAGVKDGSKTKNTGSINLLRHSSVDYKVNMMDKMNYSPEERIKLAKMMRHSVVTSLTYLSVVLAEPLTPKEKKKVAAIQNTRSKSK